ncbi:MAG: replication-associated recombination protein A [Planctomycetaceae bacterium]|nr:replication-associated recombination protein A [Planctomycetaceae bacterium]
MNLFAAEEEENLEKAKPLAARMRPRSLDEFFGQEHIVGEGKLLPRMLDADRLGSIILYGPPGCGKTSLAEVIAKHTKRQFRRLNATTAGVKDVRELLVEAENRLSGSGIRTVVFIDELHRFSRSQQDVLLPDVENGIISLIGATTANPCFALVAPLLSRSQIFEFRELTQENILQLLKLALKDWDRGLGKVSVQVEDDALVLIAGMSDGDARRALTALEIAVLSVASTSKVVDRHVVEESLQKKSLRYDASGDEHYDVASAFIKSIRGSDPDAALYWLARMLESGEDPRFIARRLVISASEDIGNADPHGLLIATAAFHATETIGMPECRINLSQATTYLACAPKSNAAYLAIDAALHDVRTQAILPVPRHLKDSHYPGAAELGHGQGYKYSHDFPDGWVSQDYLGVEREYYQPVYRGKEIEFRKRLDDLRARRKPSSDKPET